MTYLLSIAVDKGSKIHVGRLGEMTLRKGIYIYVGSAKKNLRARIKRHLCAMKKIFWHIDYLLSAKNAAIKNIWISDRDNECLAAQMFIQAKLKLVPKFGSSDCSCPSHLFFINGNVKAFSELAAREGFRYADKSSF